MTNPGLSSSSVSEKEKRFYRALEDVFVGAEVEGQSGYINLMRIKSRYFREYVFPQLREDIEAALEGNSEFRNELFDKLYDFFHRYFSESGSIYFRRTRYPQSVYEQVYTDDRDVILFWKTHMLYYVKTDRLFKSLEVEIDDGPSTGRHGELVEPSGLRFYFDVSELEHKQANERRDLVYRFDRVRKDDADDVPSIVFQVEYSSYGSKTKMLDILRELRQAQDDGLLAEDADVDEELLRRAFRVFEKQSEVDYFINKDAEKFLKEQFDLWMYRYLFEGQNIWLQRRLKQLQSLKELAYKIIEFIAQFEDELVRVWNKPKFVRDSHYVITLDRIAERDGDVLTRVLAHEGMAAQVAEWRELGMVGDDFAPDDVWERDLFGEQLDERYQYLPLDTRHVPDLELTIVGLFEHLDEALDGWLIKSENYQALNTLRPRFRGRVKTIYIDPPYNTGSDEFVYKDEFRNSTWLAMIENRIQASRSWIRQDGVIFISCDYHELHNLNLLMEDIFGLEQHVATFYFKVRHEGRILTGDKEVQEVIEHAVCFKKPNFQIAKMKLPERRELYRYSVKELVQPRRREIIDGKKVEIFEEGEYEIIETAPNDSLLKPISIRGTIRKGNSSGRFYVAHIEGKYKPGTLLKVEGIGDDRLPHRYFLVPKGLKNGIYYQGVPLTRVNRDKPYPTFQDFVQEFNTVGYEGDVAFKNGKKPIAFIDYLFELSDLGINDIVLDFFAGSGTTAHAVMNLNREDDGQRKYILVEMADYFDDVLLPRVKKVAFSSEWKDGVAQEDGQGMSHFVKYYALEQYEEVLRQAQYVEDAAPFDNPYQDPYQQYVFLPDLKMLHALELDHDENRVEVDLSALYEDIDLAETLANLRGKWIARITPEHVEFEDGERIDLQDLDWELIKPLIWW